MKLYKYLCVAVCAVCVASPLAMAKKNAAPRSLDIVLPTNAGVSQRYGNLD